MIKICAISDMHNKYKKLKLPDADIIIVGGDMTSMGKEHEIRNFLKWFSKLVQYKYKIFIAGNHDMLFDTSGHFARSLVPKNVIYLEDSGIEIMGLYFYGSPVQSPFFNWAFMKTEDRLEQHWKAVPEQTDVLITHSPAYGILDMMVDKTKPLGSPSLTDEIFNRIKPICHITGHIHSGHGYKLIDDISFINASVLDEDYEVAFNPILIEIDENKIIKLLEV